MDVRDLRRLYQETADILLFPRSVKIRWRDPANACASGTVSKNLDGSFVMDLTTSRPAVEMLGTFLEECAHVLADGDNYQKSTYSQKAPASYIKKLELTPARKAREDRAADYAKTLSNYAFANMHKYARYNEPQICACLRALGAMRLRKDIFQKFR